ncbi:MAG: HD domain-containing protein [Oscillospiraceae bacterium]|nr:HD domain-containing protein [Oscillospiraceae bacterium]
MRESERNINCYKSLVEERLPPYVLSILKRLEESGFEAYVVGGCIRDSLLSLEPLDWDICTSALPDQITECFSDYRVVLTGVKHGTVTVVIPEIINPGSGQESGSSLSAPGCVMSGPDSAILAPGSAMSGPGSAISESGTAISEYATAISEYATAISEYATAISEYGSATSEAGSATSKAGSATSKAGSAISAPDSAISAPPGAVFSEPGAAVLSEPVAASYDSVRNSVYASTGKDAVDHLDCYGKRFVEVTTFRVDGKYSDNRRPDNVRFVGEVREDLARRDFTINALAYSLKGGFVDFFGGVRDLSDGIIRCVGDPDKRFNEDGLRIMRAVRFSATYGFEIDPDTDRAIRVNSGLLKNISAERLAAELDLIILGDDAKGVIEKYVDVLLEIIPEIKPMIGFSQNNIHHVYDVWGHTLVSLEKSVKHREIRLSMLLHDIGKPECYTESGQTGHFFGHAKRGAVIAGEILGRMKYDNRTIQNVTCLIFHHSDKLICDKIHIKKKLNKLGPEMLEKLIWVKEADMQGKNPEFDGESLELICLYKSMLEEVLREKECFSVKDLAINGMDLIGAGMSEGPRIGSMLNYMLDLVVEGSLKNERDELLGFLAATMKGGRRDGSF